MRLTPPQQDMLDGKDGWPKQMAMEMLLAVGRVYDAPELIPIESVHLGVSGKSLGTPGMLLFNKLVQEGARFAVPTTLNVISVDRLANDQSGVGNQITKQLRIVAASQAMGAKSICTCNPFLLGILPNRGESVAWNESATIPYINAVLGARANREGATALASALTGLTPKYGMHVEENRRGGLVVLVKDRLHGAYEFSLLGALIGRICRGVIPIIDGIARRPTLDEFMAFGAALAIHSTLAMYHMVGITPESPSRQAAELENALFRQMSIQLDDLDLERARLDTAESVTVDAVAIGCPHASFDQIRNAATLLDGRHTAKSVQFYLHTNRDAFDRATREGIIEMLKSAGAYVTTDTCVYVAYEYLVKPTTVATDSAKMALLAASKGADVHLGSTEDCIEAAFTGRWLPQCTLAKRRNL